MYVLQWHKGRGAKQKDKQTSAMQTRKGTGHDRRLQLMQQSYTVFTSSQGSQEKIFWLLSSKGCERPLGDCGLQRPTFFRNKNCPQRPGLWYCVSRVIICLEGIPISKKNPKKCWKCDRGVSSGLDRKNLSPDSGVRSLLADQVSQAFFHRFCGFKNIRMSETLSLGEKSLSLAKNPFILMGKIWNFSWV